MLQSIIGLVLSFILGDLIGPGIVVTLLLACAVFALMRGYKVLTYALIAAAIVLGSFLVGAQMEKARCAARIQKMLDIQQASENAEAKRQSQANEELRKLRDQNFELTGEAARLRSEISEPEIREIIKTQVVERCSSARWSDREFKRLRQSAEPRRKRSGN